MVGHKPETLEGTRGRRPARTRRPRRGANNKPLRSTSDHPGVARLCCEGAQDERQSLAILSAARTDVPTSFRNVDSHGQTTRNTGKAHSRVDRVARGREEAGSQVNGNLSAVRARVRKTWRGDSFESEEGIQ